jgi:hypothetical protein
MRSRNDYRYESTACLQAIVDGYKQTIDNFMDRGWDGYMVSVLFHQLPGSRKTQLLQMNQEIERMYNRLGTRMVRKPGSPNWAGYLPIGFFVPDLLVPKRRKGDKSTIADVSINDGLHMGGIVLANQWGRIRGSLVEHFKEEKDKYVTGKIRSVGIKPITHDLDTATQYTFKSLTRRSFTPDDVLVLNWGERSSFRPCSAVESARRGFLRDGEKIPSRAAGYAIWKEISGGQR